MNELITVMALVVSMCALRALLAALKMVKYVVKAARRDPQDEMRHDERRGLVREAHNALTPEDS